MRVAAFATLLFLAAAVQAPPSTMAQTDAVTDTAGDDLRYGEEYYILPVVRGRGGGLTLAQRNGSCPFDVAQADSEVDSGYPVVFSPVVDGEEIIRLSTDMNVIFSASTICVQSTVWKLKDTDESTGRNYITTGGVIGNPGRSTVSNWFKIEKEGQDYKLVFCPGVCDICRVLCGDIGVFVENGKRWLGVNGDSAFPVMFKKA